MKTILKLLTTPLIVALTLAKLQPIQGMEKTLDINCLPLVVKALILEYAARNTNPGTFRLVCKEWQRVMDAGSNQNTIENIRYATIGPVWKRCVNAWYGMTGHEAILKKFLNGKLIYKPTEGSDVGMIVLNISDLKNPFADTFDLSKCGDAGNYLNISTGNRTRKNPENAKKIEISISLRSMMEKFGGFKDILKNGSEETAPFVLLWNWGGWRKLTCFDYLADKSSDFISANNLFDNYDSTTRGIPIINGYLLAKERGDARSFRFDFVN